MNLLDNVWVVIVLKLLIATFIVLPVLPNKAVDPWGAINPYQLWWLVILISGLSLVGYVATHNQSLIIRDVLKEPLFKEKEMAKKLGLVSMVSVPMTIKEGKVIGVLNCFTAMLHDFPETEVNLIKTVANQAAVAIFNTELMVKTKVIQEELETRKLVERAKEVLMRRRSMTVEQAYRWIQKRSMDSRKSMRHVAEAILLSEEI